MAMSNEQYIERLNAIKKELIEFISAIEHSKYCTKYSISFSIKRSIERIDHAIYCIENDDTFRRRD